MDTQLAPGESGTPSLRDLAHELNNLLAIIHGRAEILQSDGALAPKLQECVEQILKAVERAGRLTRQLGSRTKPEDSPAQAEPASAPATALAERSGERILLGVGDQGMRRFAALLLSRLGYAVIEAPSDAEAQRIWTEQRGDFDLLLSESGTAGDESAIRLVERFQLDRPNLRALLLTEGPGASSVSIANEAPGVVWLRRPFSTEQLIDAVRDCLSRRKPEPACA